ncbi:MAG: TIR domain-containing protein [Dysgonomonas sp.]
MNPKHKVFISFKTEDKEYKKYIQENLDVDMIDKSLNERIDSNDEDYVMRKIREDYLSDSTVTILLIGANSAENKGWQEQKYIKRELQASLYDGKNNTRSGILGVVLPSMYNNIYKGSYTCSKCNNSHNHVALNDTTVIKEFSYNYYIPNSKCSHAKDDKYCVLVKWDDFISTPEKYIDEAFSNREHPISQKVKVYPE